MAKPPSKAAPSPKPAAARARWAAHAAGLRRLPAWINAHRLPSAILGITILTPVVIAASLLLTSQPKPQQAAGPTPLERALAAFDAGEYTQAGALAAYLPADTLAEDQTYVVPLLRGAAAAQRADELWGQDQRRYFALAARYLQDAQDLGVEESRRGQALYLLGRSLALSGQPNASLRALEAALPLVPAKASEMHRLLAEGLAHDPARLEDAVTHYVAYLEEPTLTRPAREAVLIEVAELQERSGDTAGCRETLDRLVDNVTFRARVLVVRGKLLVREAAGAANKQTYQQAIDVLREAQRLDTLAQRVTPRAQLLVGRCYLDMQDDEHAIEAFTQVVDKHPNTPEAFAAGVERADALRRLDRDSESIESWRAALATLGDPQVFHNPWLTLEELRNRLLATATDWSTRERYEAAIALTKLMPPVVAEDRAMLLAAQTSSTWAARLKEEANRSPTAQAEPLAEQARKRYGEAGRAYLRLAKLRFATRNYPEDIFSAGESYLAGQELAYAEAAFREYLQIEARTRRSQAQVGLAEALLPQGRIDEALLALAECLETDKIDVATFRARLLAAQAWLEKGDSTRAEKLLRENIEGDLLTPASIEWRESLFTLAKTLHAERRYAAAIPRLEEFVARYGDQPSALEARYLLAESNRLLGAEALARREQEVVVEDRERAASQAAACWQAALPLYDALVTEVSRRQDAAFLSLAERQILRNCCFGRGNVLFLAERYEDAAGAYLTAANRFQDAPEVLEAYVQIAACYRRLGRPQDARGVLLQAKALLKQMPADMAFSTTTNYTRDEWSSLLDSLATL